LAEVEQLEDVGVHIAAAKAKCGNGYAVVDPFSSVVFDQSWPEIFGGLYKALGLRDRVHVCRNEYQRCHCRYARITP